MITAKEFRINKFRNEKPFYTDKSIEYLMKEFAKFHVKTALKAAFLNSEMRVSTNDTTEIPSFTDNYDDGYATITVSKDSIINSYPLNNIK